jgi:hemerythrin-like domain-containing protein
VTRAIEQLMNEHRLIEQVLASLESFAEQIHSGAEAERGTVKDYADFFNNFADKCHHGKEEDRLFVKMTESGFPREYGPIAVMLAEHTEGREHVGALAAVGGGSGPLTEGERAQIVSHATGYVPLLRAHIMKEDNILYPMAVQTIPPAEFDRMADEFEAFEASVMGEGAHERFHALAEALVAAYPPDPEKMEAGGACLGCAGHM